MPLQVYPRLLSDPCTSITPPPYDTYFSYAARLQPPQWRRRKDKTLRFKLYFRGPLSAYWLNDRVRIVCALAGVCFGACAEWDRGRRCA